MTDHPCHIEVSHPRHEWYPLVVDPDAERVLHLGMAALICPGFNARSNEETS